MARAIVAYSFGGNRGRHGEPNMVLASLVAQESKRLPDALVLVQDHIAVATAIFVHCAFRNYQTPKGAFTLIIFLLIYIIHFCYT